jgi:hypothetical protein
MLIPSADFVFELIGKDFDDLAYRLLRYSLSGSMQKSCGTGKAAYPLASTIGCTH